MQITQKPNYITRIDMDVNSGWRQKVLFLSDVHIDSQWCDRKLLKKHMDEALAENALVFINGDIFDAMQGRNDPRRSAREIREVLLGNDYFDRVLDDAIEFFTPYANILAMVGYGNHEYSVVLHNGTDLVQRFVGKMRDLGSSVVAGGYQGFIRICTYDGNANTPNNSYWISYNHGAGGEAPVTKGMIQTARTAAWISGVNCVWHGHNHQQYITHQSIVRPTNKDGVEQDVIVFLRTPGYKNEYSHYGHGFAASRNMAPSPRGCVWGELIYNSNRMTARYYADVI